MEKLKIGYFGEPGSNTEDAAKKLFGTEKKIVSSGTITSNTEENDNQIFSKEYLPFPTILDLLDALQNKVIAKAILPMENSTEGVVTSSIDSLIISQSKFVIEGEVILRIKHHLIGVGNITEIQTIISHPQALAQCSKYLRQSKAKTQPAASTSAAVKSVARENNYSLAAIGSRNAVEIYRKQNSDLKILIENIHDSENNETRFIVLGRDNKAKTGKDRTTLVFGLINKSGALVHVLDVFDALDINMTQIVSRPSKAKLGDYTFWVDIEGHQDDKKIDVALRQVATRTVFLKILGSYPIGTDF